MSVVALIIAQAVSAAAPGPCVVVSTTAVEGQAQTLTAVCGTQGIVLGRADSYQVQTNEVLPATLVDLTWNGNRRILMVSYPDGQPLLEDLSGTLALAAGRGPMSDLKGLDMDLSTFAQDGAVGVLPAADDGVSSDKSATVSLGAQIEAEQARASAVAAQE